MGLGAVSVVVVGVPGKGSMVSDPTPSPQALVRAEKKIIAVNIFFTMVTSNE